jgi:16S rRNA A1518/A1519 N6-dimethyltransferase RsmA/KsgA/DIM1 with predicted DNA glycosylase/AP lyase activity
LEKAGIEPSQRAEQLSIEDFTQLAALLEQDQPNRP